MPKTANVESTFDIVKRTNFYDKSDKRSTLLPFVAKKVERCFDNVAGVDGATYLACHPTAPVPESSKARAATGRRYEFSDGLLHSEECDAHGGRWILSLNQHVTLTDDRHARCVVRDHNICDETTHSHTHAHTRTRT